jgi:2-methylaconitate cis-trans-isomerase PrpF
LLSKVKSTNLISVSKACSTDIDSQFCQTNVSIHLGKVRNSKSIGKLGYTDGPMAAIKGLIALKANTYI